MLQFVSLVPLLARMCRGGRRRTRDAARGSVRGLATMASAHAAGEDVVVTRGGSAEASIDVFVFDRGGCCASPTTLPDKMIGRSATTRIGGEQSRISGTRRSTALRDFL
jgi:hypothetical protein